MRDSPTLEEISGEIAIIRFTNPAERNPLSHETLDRLAAFLERLKQEPTIRAVILTGTDDVFLSGADIRDLRNLDRTSATIFSQKGQSLAHALAELQPVTIAAINGYCMLFTRLIRGLESVSERIVTLVTLAEPRLN